MDTEILTFEVVRQEELVRQCSCLIANFAPEYGGFICSSRNVWELVESTEGQSIFQITPGFRQDFENKSLRIHSWDGIMPTDPKLYPNREKPINQLLVIQGGEVLDHIEN